MGDKTNIAWTDATWNPLRARHKETGAEGWACVRVSPGCQHCYAETLNETQRFGRGTGLGYTVPALEKVEHYLHEETLTKPLRRQKPRRIFVCSMTDLFGEWVTDEQIDAIFAVMALAQRHTFQVLTKRPERMRAYLSSGRRVYQNSLDGSRVIAGGAFWQEGDAATRIIHQISLLDPSGKVGGFPRLPEWPLPNVWLGVTAEDQERADERIPILLDTPAAVRFVSYEPALGRIDFAAPWPGTVHSRDFAAQLDWLIVGGESGAEARPFDVAWAHSALSQGIDAGVAVFMKQMGSRPFSGAVRVRYKHPHGANPDEWPEDLRVQEFPEVRS